MTNRCLTVLLALAATLVPALAAEAQTRPDLVGHVQSKDGQPVANASVFIYTAGPRQGTSPI